MKVTFNTTSRYDTPISSDGPVPVVEVVAGKLIDIHNQLYEAALKDYLEENNISKDDLFNNYVQLQQYDPNYQFSSTIVLKRKKYPFDVITIDLSKYWKKYLYKNVEGIDDIIMLNDEDNFGENELVYIDYARNEATIFNRSTGIKFHVPLSKISGSTIVSDALSRENTFAELYKKINV